MEFGESYYEELTRLVDAGVPPDEVLLAATRNGAYALRMNEYLGTIEEGKYADLLLVEGSPWEDIEELRQVRLVVQAGHVVVDNR